jgi:hypothetical protein
MTTLTSPTVQGTARFEKEKQTHLLPRTLEQQSELQHGAGAVGLGDGGGEPAHQGGGIGGGCLLPCPLAVEHPQQLLNPLLAALPLIDGCREVVGNEISDVLGGVGEIRTRVPVTPAQGYFINRVILLKGWDTGYFINRVILSIGLFY